MCIYIVNMQVIWKRLYKTVSFQNTGTLYHLRNTVGRSNVTGSPKDNFNECEDFFFTVVRAHIIAAAMEVLGMDSLIDTAKNYVFPNPRDLSSEQRKGLLMTPALDVVTKFFSLGLHTSKCVTLNHLYSAYIHACTYVLIPCIYRFHSNCNWRWHPRVQQGSIFTGSAVHGVS